MAPRNMQTLVEFLQLAPHPEGGFYRETYRSAERLEPEGLPERFGSARNMSTAIYFLLPAGAKSHLHRIKSDEIWHFYQGEPLELTEIHPDGSVVRTVLGQDFAAGQKPQHIVVAGCWFGGEPLSAEGYSLVGCTVAPGFDFEDFEMASRKELLHAYPRAAEDIVRLTD